MAFTIPCTEKEATPPIFSNEEIESWMTKNNSVRSSICVLLVGDPKTGKTGVTLDIGREPDEKIVVIEMNSDNGSKLNKKEFHSDDPNIIVLDPREVTIDPVTGDYHVDYKRSMAKIKALLVYLDSHKHDIKLKSIVFDGADVFLSEICEAQMRMDKHIDVTGGVNQLYWKMRNNYFYEIMNQLFAIDVDKYIITHFKEDNDGKKIYNIQKNFPDKVHTILEFRKEEGTENYYVKVVSDRRNKPDLLGEEICIMEHIDGNRVWHGFRL